MSVPQPPKMNNWLENSQKLLQTQYLNRAPKEQLDEKVVQTIVQKLGYTEDEIRRYVLTDKNSFVGVLYQKLYDDQNEKRMLMEK